MPVIRKIDELTAALCDDVDLHLSERRIGIVRAIIPQYIEPEPELPEADAALKRMENDCLFHTYSEATVRMTNDLATLRAHIHRDNSRVLEAVDDAIGGLEDVLGEWACVDAAYCPERLQGAHKALDAVYAIRAALKGDAE